MRVPVELADAFNRPFQDLIAGFAAEQGWVPDAEAVANERFLARSIVPHVKKLSSLFNRVEAETPDLAPYWKESANPAHLRLAYFLYFMPSNLFRVASVWAELARLGFRWPHRHPLRGIEFGAGPAAGACGIAAGERFGRGTGLPEAGNWALIEQDKAMLQIGNAWAEKYFSNVYGRDWGVRPFHRKIDLSEGLLPRKAPTFNLWVMSYFLNELWGNKRDLAGILLSCWERHMEEGGVAIIVEPALKEQSRKLLELRRELLSLIQKRESSEFKILLPCLGHQACGALAAEGDWCHEDVSWWRPPYFKQIDAMASLDRKSLPFSYLVVVRDPRPQGEILTELSGGLHRLVSPAFEVGSDLEFYLCGQDGKRRARYRPRGDDDPAAALGRGDIFCEAQIRGDVMSSRVERFSRLC